MKVFKSILVGLLSFLNSFLSLGVISLVVEQRNGGEATGFIFMLALIVLFSFFICGLREAIPIAIPTICEVLFAPLAFFRFLLGVILRIVTKNDFSLSLEDIGDAEDVPSTITSFLFYYEIPEAQDRSPLGNFFVQGLIVLPISAAISYGSLALFAPGFLVDLHLLDPLFWDTYGVLAGIVLVVALLTLVVTLAAMKTSYVDIYVPERTVFYNSNTGAYSSKTGRYQVTRSGQRAGWEAIHKSGGYVESKAHLYIYAVVLAICSPILIVTQLLGTVMAFVAIFTRRIYSSTGEILLSDVPLKFLQAPLAVLCSFVFC